MSFVCHYYVIFMSLNKEIFDEAIVKTIKSFLDPETYEKFIKDKQEEIKDLEDYIKNLF